MDGATEESQRCIDDSLQLVIISQVQRCLPCSSTIGHQVTHHSAEDGHRILNEM